MSKKISIRELSRQATDGDLETLTFEERVTVLVGEPNTGKSVWLKMLDYLLGDTGTAEEAFGVQDATGALLTEKYQSLTGAITIDNEEYVIERRWKDSGLKHKVMVNGEKVPANDFSRFILEKLAIPVLHFPKGNPYMERAWPQLSWRMLLRHIYRQERFWAEIADHQPEVEQFAVLTQFLGVADKLFSEKTGEIIEKRKELVRLQAQKEQFDAILDSIVKDLAPKETGSIKFTTKEAIANQISLLERKVDELLTQRERVIEEEERKAANEEDALELENLRIAEERMQRLEELERLSATRMEIELRRSELKRFYETVSGELVKLKRSQVAGEIMGDIRVTHCPACDQEVECQTSLTNECFLCHRPIHSVDGDTRAASRIDFEAQQLSAESKELAEIGAQLSSELDGILLKEAEVREQVSLLERRLRPLRQAMSAFVSPKLTLIDSERGRVEEMIENFKRIATTLEQKTRIIAAIDRLESELRKKGAEADEFEADLNLQSASSALEDQMANYLNSLNRNDANRWPLGRVRFDLTERGFRFRVDNSKWDSIGATYKCYFLLAYHYGLLALSDHPGYHYPGLFIVDFPPVLADGVSLKDKENYLIEPFVDLCQKSGTPLQVIVAGRSFENLANVNRIELEQTWV